MTPSRGQLTRLTPTVTEKMRPWRRLAPSPTLLIALRHISIVPGNVRVTSTLGQHLAGHLTSVGGAASMAETLMAVLQGTTPGPRVPYAHRTGTGAHGPSEAVPWKSSSQRRGRPSGPEAARCPLAFYQSGTGVDTPTGCAKCPHRARLASLRSALLRTFSSLLTTRPSGGAPIGSIATMNGRWRRRRT